MDFRRVLEEIAGRVPNTVAVTLMGFDGIAVDTVQGPANPDYDVNSLLVEYSNLLDQIRKAAELFASGAVEEVSIRTEKLLIILRIVTAEYFVAQVLAPEANSGLARYRLRVAAPALAAEL